MSRAQKRGKKFSGVLIKRVILEKIYGIFVGTNETRDFKIGHYGRLGRLDAYTGGLRP